MIVDVIGPAVILVGAAAALPWLVAARVRRNRVTVTAWVLPDPQRPVKAIGGRS